MTETLTTEAPTVENDKSVDKGQAKRIEAFTKVFGVPYMERFTDPIHFFPSIFLNYRIHKFYEHNFAFMSRNLFSEYVYLRRPKYNRDILTKYHDLMDRKLAVLISTQN